MKFSWKSIEKKQGEVRILVKSFRRFKTRTEIWAILTNIRGFFEQKLSILSIKCREFNTCCNLILVVIILVVII